MPWLVLRTPPTRLSCGANKQTIVVIVKVGQNEVLMPRQLDYFHMWPQIFCCCFRSKPPPPPPSRHLAHSLPPQVLRVEGRVTPGAGSLPDLPRGHMQTPHSEPPGRGLNPQNLLLSGSSTNRCASTSPSAVNIIMMMIWTPT